MNSHVGVAALMALLGFASALKIQHYQGFEDHEHKHYTTPIPILKHEFQQSKEGYKFREQTELVNRIADVRRGCSTNGLYGKEKYRQTQHQVARALELNEPTDKNRETIWTPASNTEIKLWNAHSKNEAGGNGIHAHETGHVINHGDEKHSTLVQQGSVSYHDEHGHPIVLTYIADEHGFRPQGDHLPTPPPLPIEHYKAIEQHNALIAQHQELSQQQGHQQGHQQESGYQLGGDVGEGGDELSEHYGHQF